MREGGQMNAEEGVEGKEGLNNAIFVKCTVQQHRARLIDPKMSNDANIRLSSLLSYLRNMYG